VNAAVSANAFAYPTRRAIELAPVEPDAAGGGACQAHEGVHRGGLAGAVAAERGKCTAVLDGQVDTLQDLALSVAGA
jgi:hypothetical protein